MSLERAFSGEGIDSIQIELRRGDIWIEPSDGDQIIVRIELSNGASDADLASDVSNGQLNLSQRAFAGDRPGHGLLDDLGLGQFLGLLGRIDVHVAVPTRIGRISATTGLGSARVDRWDGEVMVRTGKGDVTLGTGSGRIDAICGLGEVRLERFTGFCGIQTGMGEVTVGGGDGTVRIHTGKGKVQINDATVTLEANTGMGEILLERVAGQANVRTGFGKLQVIDARDLGLVAFSGNGDLSLSGAFGSIQARAGLGAISCQLDHVGGTVDLNSGNGAVEVVFATDQVLRVDAATGRGRIDSEVPLMQVGQPGPEGFFSRRVVGTVGSGEIQATVRVRTGFGNIRLARRVAATPASEPSRSWNASTSTTSTVSAAATSSATATAETPSAAPAETASNATTSPEQTRLEVLRALGRGEITVEEAERRLSAL